MAVRIEAGRGQDADHLVADIGNGQGRARISAGGEETDQAQLAFELTSRRKQLDADIVHVSVAVHAGLHIGLGDDEGMRLTQKFEDFRGDGDEFASAPQHFDGRITQYAEARIADRVEIRRAIAGDLLEAILAQAEKGEIVVGQPIEKLHRLGDFIGRERRWIGPVMAGGGGNPLAHRLPVGDADAHIGIDTVERLDEPCGAAGDRRAGPHECG